MQTFSAPVDGWYEVQLWGSAGMGDWVSGGHGAYTAGTVWLTKNTELFVLVGGFGTQDAIWNGGMCGWNGGGPSCSLVSSCGGGATDIRLNSAGEGSTDWRTGLESRIMVAGGGGGASGAGFSANGGAAGGTIGLQGVLAGGNTNIEATGGTQTSGGHSSSGVNGGFGYGGHSTAYDGAGGGGGWYGGGAGGMWNGGDSPGAGGSSFILGYPGCTDRYKATQQRNGWIPMFKNMDMRDGRTMMPDWSGNMMEGSAYGFGHAKFTYLGK